MSWPKMKRTILEGAGAQFQILDLKRQSATELPQETILDVTEAVAAAEDEGVRVNWIDQEIRKILKAWDHHRLDKSLPTERENHSLQQQLDEASSELEHLEVEMAGQGTDPASLGEYIIHLFQ